MINLRNKKLLVLGGKPIASHDIVSYARRKGVYTIVTDFLDVSESPAKQIANESWMVSTADVDEIVRLSKDHEIDGVFTGVHEFNLEKTMDVCERLGLPFYSTREQWEITRNKNRFKQLCREFDIPVVEDYSTPLNNLPEASYLSALDYPVVVKPIDSSSGRGISICRDPNEFIAGYKKALTFSKSKDIIVERFMTGKEVGIYYIIQNGEIYLTAMADRHTKHIQDGIISLPVLYVFPSLHLNSYRSSLNEKVINMFKSIGLENGALFIDSFIEQGECIFNEMGFRLSGSQEYKILEKISGISTVEMMVNYSLTGNMSGKNISKNVNPDFNQWGCSISFLAKPCKIGKITGMENVAKFPEVIAVVPAYRPGDVIAESDEGTLKQVIIRVFTITQTKNEMVELIDKVHNTINAYSENGENILLPAFNTRVLFDQL